METKLLNPSVKIYAFLLLFLLPLISFSQVSINSESFDSGLGTSIETDSVDNDCTRCTLYNLSFNSNPLLHLDDYFNEIVEEVSIVNGSVGDFNLEEESLAPNIICPGNQTGSVDTSCNFALPDYTGLATITGDSTLIITQSPAQGTLVGVGPTNIVLTVTDLTGTAQCSFDVVVSDVTAPTFTVASDQDVNMDGSCQIVIPNVIGTNSDCSAVTVTQSPAAGTTVAATHNTTIDITVSAVDAFGNNATDQTVTLTPKDVTAPVTPTLADVTAECTTTAVAPTTTDNCSGIITGITADALTYSTQGTHVITWRFDDGNGNVINVPQNVVIDDITLPTASNPANINVQCLGDVPMADPAVVTTEGDNCGTTTVTFVSQTAEPAINNGTITRTYLVDDGNGNTINVFQDIIINDNTPPALADLPDLFSDCYLTVTPPIATDNCDITITGVTSGSLIFNTLGTDIIYWTFTDSSGNSIIKPQNITITDTNAPIPDVSSLPEVNITGCQISSISDLTIPTATDDCEGIIQGTLSDGFVFPFIFSGTQTIDWEFKDSNGNVTYQSQDITLTPILVSGGTLDGTFESIVFENQIDISSCGVAISVELNLSGEIGTIVKWEKFAVNHGFWEEITDADGDDNKYTAALPIGGLESTYYRVLVQTGTCLEFSNQFFVRALPAGDPPTVQNLDPDEFYCLGDQVNLLATSNYSATQESIPDDKGEGDFNQGQFPRDPDGWLVDGAVGGFTAGGSATKPRNWSAKTCNNQPNGNIEYCGGDGKYAIAYGDYSDSKYRGPDPSTLETPILDFSDAESASLDFDQAYNFVNDDYAVIEISTDGGVNYSTLRLMHAVGSGSLDWYSAGTAESYAGSDATHYNFDTDNTSIDLTAYLGMSNLRIRWTFSGTSSQSAWALENIEVNKLVTVETDVEWTDGIGDPGVPPIAGGSTQVPISFIPDAPGLHQYGGTALINGCRTYDIAGTALTDIYVSYSYAGEDIVYASQDCGQNVVQLNAYDNTKSAIDNAAKGAFTIPPGCLTCDDDGTGDIGKWTVNPDPNNSCGTGFFISNDRTKYPDASNDPDALFTAEAGNYTLTWTVNGCGNDISVTTINCNQVNFDGSDDYVDILGDDGSSFNNNIDLSGDFSIEVWIKPESISGSHSIFSKRDGTYSGNDKGCDLSIDGTGVVSFSWNKNSKIDSSPYKIGTNRWYHIAITHSSNLYTLYIDGVETKIIGGGSPEVNEYKAFLGAMDVKTGDEPVNYFNGWMDEFRIWDVGLTSDQVHQMMNQKIILSPTISGNVQGDVVPIDVNGLSWNNLACYFQMESVNCGYLNATAGSVRGKLKNTNSPQEQSAPIPYTSSQNGNWNTMSTWSEPNVWNAPNSDGVDGSRIDWNIVRTSNNIDADRDLKVLGLLVDANEMQMNGTTTLATSSNSSGTGNGLTITHYLRIDGVLDLEGESQLVQIEGSVYEETSTGYLERDQQGTGNIFRYNDWSSPVYSVDSGNKMFTIADVLKDGSTPSNPQSINFVGGYNGSTGTPISIAEYWLYVRNANPFTSIDAAWDHVSRTDPIQIGAGFLMKGTGSATDQNYVFKGKPNNGDITLTVKGDNDYLVGNPYPSAIDADLFIADNATSLGNNGTIYFWDHFGGNSHILNEYEAGHATYNYMGPVGAASNLAFHTVNPSASGTKTSGRYIAVGQAFYVVGIGSGDQDVVFKNSQRIFVEEDGGTSSVFMKPSKRGGNSKPSNKQVVSEDTRTKFRIGFNTPNGGHRQLLIGFDERATDNVDYGFDGLIKELNNEDMYWEIDHNKYVIQGTNSYSLDSEFPLGITIKEAGTISIEVDVFENVEVGTRLYIKDNLTGETYDISSSAVEFNLEAGEYSNRFFLVFQPRLKYLSEVKLTEGIHVFMNNKESNLYINKIVDTKIESVRLFNTLGQQLVNWNGIFNERTIALPVNNLAVGVYIVKVNTKDGSFTKKILIE